MWIRVHTLLTDLPQGSRSGGCVLVVIHSASAGTVGLVCSEVMSALC